MTSMDRWDATDMVTGTVELRGFIVLLGRCMCVDW